MGRPYPRRAGRGGNRGAPDLAQLRRLAALLACFLLGLALVVIRRLAGTEGFVLVPRRWVAERTLGWFGRWRRLARDYEELPEASETMVKLATIRLMLHRLAPPNRKRLPAS